jgi:hypothetical protein
MQLTVGIGIGTGISIVKVIGIGLGKLSPEASVTYYQTSLRNNPQERRSHLRLGRSLSRAFCVPFLLLFS